MLCVCVLSSPFVPALPLSLFVCRCLSRCCITTSLQVRSLAHDLSCRLPVDAFKGTHDASHHGTGYAGICLGDPDIGELTISEMSPEDIRAELKRYTTRFASRRIYI